MNRFFSDKIFDIGDKIEITDKKVKQHILKSLRLKIGDKVEICSNNQREFISEIIFIDDKSVIFSAIKEITVKRELDVEIHLFQGVPKAKKMDYIIQKTVEAGVFSITPVDMERSVSKFVNKDKTLKMERFSEISLSAAEQSKRQIVPAINSPILFKELSSKLSDYDIVLLADENENDFTLKDYKDYIKKAKKIAVIIGPEGGISDKERDFLSSLSSPVSLGRRILRTETAALYLLAQISYLLS